MSQTDLIEVRPTLSESLRDIVETHRVDAALDWLGDRAPHVIADQLARMDAVSAGVAFRLLPKDKAPLDAAMMERLFSYCAQRLLRHTVSLQ